MKRKVDNGNSFLAMLQEHENEWVALSNDESTVVAFDASYRRAITKAKGNGENHPVMVKVPPSEAVYLL